MIIDVLKMIAFSFDLLKDLFQFVAERRNREKWFREIETLLKSRKWNEPLPMKDMADIPNVNWLIIGQKKKRFKFTFSEERCVQFREYK